MCLSHVFSDGVGIEARSPVQGQHPVERVAHDEHDESRAVQRRGALAQLAGRQRQALLLCKQTGRRT